MGVTPDLAVRRLPRVGEIESVLPDGSTMKFWTDGEDGVTHQLYWLGWNGFEPETAQFVRDVCSDEVDLMIDVGAHVGYFSILGALSGARRVLAVEPMFVAQQRLTRNIRLNELESRIEVCCFAAGREPSVARFLTRTDGSLPSGSSMESAPWRGVDHDEITVAVHPIDEIAARSSGRVGLIKIDTETTEPEVLAGATRTLGEDRPVVIAEVLPIGPASQLAEVMEPFDYRFFQITRDGLAEMSTITTTAEERNWALVPAEIDVRALYSAPPGEKPRSEARRGGGSSA